MREIVWLDATPNSVLSHPGSPQANAIGTVAFIATDHLTTPRTLLSPAIQQTASTETYGVATEVWRWDSRLGAFGEVLADKDPDSNLISYSFPLRFPGQYRDSESGLHYNYFRDYEAGTGRYVESDPIGLVGGANTYLYVDAQPLFYVDAQGLIKWSGQIAFGSASPFNKRGKVKLNLPQYNNLSMTLWSECIDGLRMRAQIHGKGTLTMSTWIPYPVLGGGGTVELDDGMASLSSESLLGKLKFDGSGYFSAGGNITAGLGRGTFSVYGLLGGDIKFDGNGVAGDWNGRVERCECR